MSSALPAPVGVWGRISCSMALGGTSWFVFSSGHGLGKGKAHRCRLHIPSAPRVHGKVSLFCSVLFTKLQPLTGFTWVPCFPLNESLGSGRSEAAIGQARVISVLGAEAWACLT